MKKGYLLNVPVRYKVTIIEYSVVIVCENNLKVYGMHFPFVMLLYLLNLHWHKIIIFEHSEETI